MKHAEREREGARSETQRPRGSTFKNSPQKFSLLFFTFLKYFIYSNEDNLDINLEDMMAEDDVMK